MTWLTNNLGTMLIALGLAVSVITTWATNKSRIEHLEKGLKEADEDRAKLRVEFAAHQQSTALHIDPSRDKRIWDDFKGEAWRRFDRLEEKIEKLMIHVPPNG